MLAENNPAGEPSRPPDFHADSLGIPGDHPFGNCLMISLQKFRGNKWENSKWIFPPPFLVESLGIFPGGNFPGAPLKYFKMQFNDKGRVPVM